jgi:hypothetical protein
MLGEGITDAMEDLIPKSETQTDSEIQLTGMSLENVRKKKNSFRGYHQTFNTSFHSN